MSAEIMKHDGGDIGSLQMISAKDAKLWYKKFVAFAQSILKVDLDYGVIPGTGKPSLYKPGAEKLRFAFGLTSETVCIDKTISLDPMFIDYTYQCTIKAKSGQILAQCEGSCNSHEPNYRYLWVWRKDPPDKEEAKKLKLEGVGKWKKETDKKTNTTTWLWFDRTDNTEVFAKKNTIQKMAQKRAFVGAILLATGASEFFTQDIDKLDGDLGDGEMEPGEGQTDNLMDDPIWIEEVNKCKTQEELTAFYNQNKTVVFNNEGLKKLFKQRENELKKATAKDKAAAAANDLDQKLKSK